MTAVRYISFWCDKNLCNATVDTPEHTFRDGRRWAERHAGWHCPGPSDWCPDHKGNPT